MERIDRKRPWRIQLERMLRATAPRKNHKIKHGKKRMTVRRRRRDERLAVLGAFLIIGLILLFLLIKGVAGILFGVRIDIKDVQAMRIPPTEVLAVAEISGEENVDFATALTAHCIDNRFFTSKPIPRTKEQIKMDLFARIEKVKESIGETGFLQYLSVIETITAELAAFPIASGFYSTDYTFGDTWGAKSTICSAKEHQGIDIFDRENIHGRLSIASMTNGTVESKKKEKDGWNITVRTERGSRYEYQRLFNVPDTVEEGGVVSAGAVLGYMGGGGEAKGAYPVSAHIGICLNTGLAKEGLWINPYPFLRQLEVATGMISTQ